MTVSLLFFRCFDHSFLREGTKKGKFEKNLWLLFPPVQRPAGGSEASLGEQAAKGSELPSPALLLAGAGFSLDFGGAGALTPFAGGTLGFFQSVTRNVGNLPLAAGG